MTDNKPLDPTAAPMAPNTNGVDVHPQLRGETIAFALQNGAFTLGANLLEPFINRRFQRYRHDHDPSHPKFGTYGQNFVGELVGDVSGMATLVLAETLIPNQLHSFTRACRRAIDPLTTTAAHIALGRKCDEPDYDKKVEEWKTFQGRNLVRSVIAGAGNIAGNLAGQKWIAGNPAPTKVIFQGKLLSTVCTTAMGIALRALFPDQIRSAEVWLGQKIRPLMEPDAPKPSTHTANLLNQKPETSPSPAI